ncbi:MAG: hypothetical protein ACFCUI_13345 [Bernardetiaceae bacterium]
MKKCIWLSLIFIFSCTQEKEVDIYTPSDFIVGEVTIRTDSLFTDLYDYHSFKYKGKKYLVGLDAVNENGLFFYDLETEEIPHHIPSIKEGKDKFIIEDYYIHNSDSIFLVWYVGERVKLTNIEQTQETTFFVGDAMRKKDSISFGYMDKGGNCFFWSSGQKKMIFPVYPLFENTSVNLYNNGYFAFYDTYKNEFSDKHGKYPRHLFANKEGYFLYAMDMTVFPKNGNIFVILFPQDHNIYTYDTQQRLLTPISTWKSKYLPVNFERLSANADFQLRENYSNMQGMYINDFYDVDHQTLYRVVKHKQPLKNADGLLNEYLESSWSIMYGRLGADARDVKEMKFPERKYHFGQVCYVGDGKFLVSKNNPYNEENIENEIAFDLIEMK